MLANGIEIADSGDFYLKNEFNNNYKLKLK